MHFRPRCVVWIVYAFRLGKSHVNGYFICVGLRGKILRSVVGAVPVCPPVSPCKGASIVHSPHNVCIFVWKRRYADVRAGTQAPPLRFRLGRLHVGGFVCWENGAHEPTPSVLYFCQPRVADDRRLPWVKSWRGTYAIGIVLFKINLHAGNHSFGTVW